MSGTAAAAVAAVAATSTEPMVISITCQERNALKRVFTLEVPAGRNGARSANGAVVACETQNRRHTAV